LELGGPAVEVSGGELLTEELDAAHRGETQLRRRWPDHFRQSVRPKRFIARRASFRPRAPGLSVFHGFAFRRGGTTASAPLRAMASRQARPS
jgi:hypothetical protein